MAGEMRPTIAAARKCCEAMGAHQVVVVAFDRGGYYACVSYGVTKDACQMVAPTCDAIADMLRSGRILAPAWPGEDQPCETCHTAAGHADNCPAGGRMYR